MDTIPGGKSEEATNLNISRGEIAHRLAAVKHRLGKKGLSAVFIGAVKADPMGDMGILNSLVMHMMLGGAIADWLDLDLEAMTGNDHMSLSGAMEGICSLKDMDARVQPKPAKDPLSAYPFGRRRAAPAKEGRMSRKFNKTANQNKRLSSDVGAELACMFEIVDMLDYLEKKSGAAAGFDNNRPAYILPKKTHAAKQMTL